MKRAYTAARAIDMRDSGIIRLLYRLRGMPAKALTLDGMIDTGFIPLSDDAGREIVLGLIGRFWRPSGYLEDNDAAGFAAFHRPGRAKSVFNITFTPLSEKWCRVTT